MLFQQDSYQIDIGSAAEATLIQLDSFKNISARQRLEIEMDCEILMITLLEKSLKKASEPHKLDRSIFQSVGCSG